MMKKWILMLVIFLALCGCVEDNDTSFVDETPGLPSPCSPAPVPEAIVEDLNDGSGGVQATDSTVGATSWSWTLPGCSPDRSQRPTFTADCPLGRLNWRLEVCNATCCSFTSGSVEID